MLLSSYNIATCVQCETRVFSHVVVVLQAKFKAGWLYKKNPKGLPGMRLWKRRWCVVRKDRMDYYAHSTDVEAKGKTYSLGYRICVLYNACSHTLIYASVVCM